MGEQLHEPENCLEAKKKKMYGNLKEGTPGYWHAERKIG